MKVSILAPLLLLSNRHHVLAYVWTGLIKDNTIGKCMERMERGASIRPRECDMNNPNQKFAYDFWGNGFIKIMALDEPDKCLDGVGFERVGFITKHAEGDAIFMYQCTADAPNHWWQKDADRGYINTQQKYCVQANGDEFVIFECFQHPTHNMQFITATASPTSPPTPPPTAPPTSSPTPPPTSPPSTASLVAPVVPLSAKTDFHFKTWSGTKFDFHGQFKYL
jgi:Ricin-type beta-trefoil lectin domain